MFRPSPESFRPEAGREPAVRPGRGATITGAREPTITMSSPVDWRDRPVLDHRAEPEAVE